jgi:hypothetical protein
LIFKEALKSLPKIAPEKKTECRHSDFPALNGSPCRPVCPALFPGSFVCCGDAY